MSPQGAAKVTTVSTQSNILIAVTLTTLLGLIHHQSRYMKHTDFHSKNVLILVLSLDFDNVS
jgi:hypothetical protein